MNNPKTKKSQSRRIVKGENEAKKITQKRQKDPKKSISIFGYLCRTGAVKAR